MGRESKPRGTSYRDVVVDGQVNDSVAWYYPAPKDAAKQITDRIVFWEEVQVTR